MHAPVLLTQCDWTATSCCF